MVNKTFDKRHVNWLLSVAYSYLVQNMAPQAITLLELLEVLQPNNRQGLRMLAYAYLLVARYQQVIETITTLVRLKQTDNEQNAYLCLLRARALWGLGKSEEAKTEFEKYVSLVASLTSMNQQQKHG